MGISAKKGEKIPAKPPSLPRAPAHLNPIVRREWRRIVPILDAEGLLSRLDIANLTAYAMTFARIEAAEKAIALEGEVITTPSGIKRANPRLGILNTSLRQLSALSGQLGLSPSARTHVQVDEEKLERDFQEKWGPQGTLR